MTHPPPAINRRTKAARTRGPLNPYRARLMLAELGDPAPTRIAPLALLIRPPSSETPAQLGLALDDDRTDAGVAVGTAPELDYGSAQTLLKPCVIVEPALSMRFRAAMLAAGASQVSDRGFRVPVAEPSPGLMNAALRRVIDILPHEIVYTANSWQQQHQRGARTRHARAALGRLPVTTFPRLVDEGEHPEDGPLARVGVVMSASPHGLYVKLCTRPGDWLDPDSPVHRWSTDGIRDAAPIDGDSAVELLLHARADGLEILDPHAIAETLEHTVRGSTVARQVPGMPGLAVLVEGQPDERPVARRTTPAERAAERIEARRCAGGATAIDERVADAARMARARPHLDSVLVGRQRELVARFLATDYGVLNAASVGSGKTVMTLRGLRAHAQRVAAHRTLVVCAKALRSQWAEEVARSDVGFPEARVLVPDGRSLAAELIGWDAATDEDAGIVIASYEQARLRCDELLALTYDVLVCDEASRLGNASTQLSQALWRLRGRARVAVALTGTPISKRLDELDAIVAWVRADPAMRRARAVSRSCRTIDGTSMRRLRRALGPALFRMTRDELAAHMPQVLPAKHLFLDPTTAETDGAVALMQRVAELYASLCEQLAAAQALRPGDPRLAEARAALARQQGLLLSAFTIGRMWSIDPRSLRRSQSVAAALIASEGLIDEAESVGITKPQVVAETVAAAVAAEERVLVFCEFASCLELLRDTLAAEHGVSAGLFIQGTSARERDALKRRFQSGEVGALLVGPVGNEGHNLPADVVIHYDLPPVASRLEQRTGRAARGFSGVASVHVLIPVMRGTIEERVAELLIPRAAAAHAALDGNRDKHVEDSDIARQLSTLAGELADRSDSSIVMQVASSVLRDAQAGRLRRRPGTSPSHPDAGAAAD